MSKFKVGDQFYHKNDKNLLATVASVEPSHYVLSWILIDTGRIVSSRTVWEPLGIEKYLVSTHKEINMKTIKKYLGINN